MVASQLELLLKQLQQSTVVVLDIARSNPSAVVWPAACAALAIVVFLVLLDVYKTFTIPSIKVDDLSEGRSRVSMMELSSQAQLHCSIRDDPG
jgi:hypothetical protein